MQHRDANEIKKHNKPRRDNHCQPFSFDDLPEFNHQPRDRRSPPRFGELPLFFEDKEGLLLSLGGGHFWRGVGFGTRAEQTGEEEGGADDGDDGCLVSAVFPFSGAGDGDDVAGGAFGFEDVFGIDAVFLF